MSFSEWSNKKKKKKYDSFSEWCDAKYGTNTAIKQEDDDIAPVKGGNKESWFKSGAFDDGYDFGDVTKTILGTAGDVVVGAGKGITRMVEGVTDLVGYGVAGVADLFGADDYADTIREATSDNTTDRIWKPASDYVDRTSVLGNKADAISEGLGYVGGIILTGGLGSAAGLGSAGVTALTTGLTGLSGMGSGMSEAYASGASDEDAFTYGLITGTAEAATELLFGGLGKFTGAVGISKGVGALDDIFAKKVTSKIANQTARTLTQAGIKATGEGLEEVLSGVAQAFGKKATYMSEEDLRKLIEDENLLDQFIVGTVVSGIAQGGDVVKSVKNKTDFITGNTKEEQAVIDKEIENRIAEQEKNGNKLTTKEKGKIEKQVQNDFEKGYISIDTIEDVLGGDTLKEYKSIAEREKTLTDEISQLENTPKEQITVKQSERLLEAREELKNLTNKTELKTRLSDEVFNLVKDSRLAESYNERARKGQAFEADLTQYTGKQKEAVERAVKSGVLNNTNRSHELVDVLSKIEADKGIAFDYTNTEKLKETGFAVEGKTVNGFVKDGAVTLNVQSPKAWQSTVGHEITHILEGTDAYGALQSALFEYAESKGELESRRTNLTALYKNIDADIDAELTADLVGDYLFSDKDFINKLTGNRTLFQKIYDEIKYLWNVATGKEKAEIEKVKKEFDNVWKELSTKGINEVINKTADGKIENAKYSVSADSEGNRLSKEQSEYFKDSKVVDEDGNLRVVYHGTYEDFNVFDIAKTSSANAFGKGHYFTSKKTDAQNNYATMSGADVHTKIEELAWIYFEEMGYTEADYESNDAVEEWNVAYDKAEEFYKSGRVVQAYLDIKNPVYARGDELYDANGEFVTARSAEYLKKLGYDGIIDYGVADRFGHFQDLDADTVHYVVFDSNQIKLTTNKNPTADPDIRYSVSEDTQKTDSVYLKLAENGNTEIAQKMVDDAAKNAGYDIKAYHGTGYDFTVFDKSKQGDNYQDWGRLGKGFYFAPTSREAETWAELSKGSKNKVMPVYLRSENMLDSFEALPDNLKDTIPENWDSLTRRLAEKYAYNYIEYMQEFGYNVQEILTQKGYDGINGHTEFVVFDPEQVKSADAITYDDKGNVIPLSERFNKANDDIRYSISEDSEGNELSLAVQKRFANSKAVDENGNLKVLYHGTYNGEFYTFDKSKGSVEGDFGSGFYFTDSEYDVSDNYEGGGADFDNKVARRAEQIESEEGIEYHEAEQRAREELFKGSFKHTVYLNIENPAIVGETNLFDYESYAEEYDREDYDSDEDYEADVERLIADDIDQIVWNIEQNLEVSHRSALEVAGVLWGAVNEGGIGVEELKANINNLEIFDDNGNFVGGEIARQIIESLGYDGIIDNTVATKFNMNIGEGTTHYIVFKPNQIKSIDNHNPTDNPDIRYSLSAETNADYMSAVERGDTETAQRIVEETANSLGYNIRAYHGTARGDRVGNVFLPERATSGPMAYFTSDKQIAENYSKSKQDTSMAYDPDYDSYETQFRIKTKYSGQDVPLYRAWGLLPNDAKQRITIKAGQVHENWDGDYELILDPETNEANGGFQWQLKEARGNAIKALTEQWLNSGTLFNDEGRFLDVLEMTGVTEEFKKIGMDNLYFKDPNAKHEKVYDTFLKITKPFDTATVNEEFIADLENWYDEQDQSKYDVESSNADLWDKNNRDAYDFANILRNDLANNTTHAWTSIPDSVTDYLKSKGYDGIKDTGGKYSGESHIVYIPFSSEQIKFAEPIVYDDNGKVIPLSERFNPENKDIRYSLSNKGEQFAPVGNYSTPLKETALAPMQEDAENTTVENIVDDAPMPTDADVPPEIEYYNMPDTTALDDKALNNIGKSLRETLSLTAEETKAIQEIVQEYSTSETPSRDNLFKTIKDKFGEKLIKEKNEGLAEIKRFLRTSKINVSPKIKSDIVDYRDFRKSIGNKIGISKDGIPVDTAYQELSVLYPDVFSDEIWNETDQFLKMVEVAKKDTFTTDTYSLDDEVIQEAVNIISNEVRGYKENLSRIAAEETAKETLDSIAPLKATQITDGSRGDALLYESLDNYPVETVEQKVTEKIRAVEAELADNKQLRREAIAQYNKDIERLSAEYIAKKNKNSKVANNLVRRIANLERLKASVDADYSKRISDLEARAEKMKDPKYSRAMHKQAKMQEHAKFAENLLGDTSTWVDKKIGLQYATNTERRNLRDIVRDANGNVDIAKADAIDDALNGKYNREEAAKKRELAKARGKYADLKITKAEDAYIQMLGELRYNPETTLKKEDVDEYYEKHKNKIDAEKVDKIIDLARKDYDSWLNRVNAELKKQGMREIPYRQGYFPHFTEPKQNFIQKLLNWKVQDNEIPTSIAGLTETFRPVKSWQSFDKTRYSDETDYSFTKGFDAYSQGVLDWIYHLDTLQKRRAVENHIRFTHSDEGIQKRIKEVYANEELDANEAQAQIEHILAEAKNPLNNFVQDFTTHTNILAGKKNSLDRTVEQATNRHIYSVMTNVQNRMSANMVLANVRSALTNIIPITQSWAQVSPLRSLQATKDTIANAIKDDGVIEKSAFLTNRLREVDNLYKTNWDKVLDKAGIMFEIVDNFSSQVIWRSKYNQNLANGMTESQAIKNADQFAENVMAGRSKGNEPTLFNAKNPLTKAFTMFQLEVNNQYGYLFKDVPNDLKAETNHWKLNLAKGYTTAFVGAYVYNALMEQVAGSGAALDPIGIIEDLLRDLGLFDDDEEKEADEVVTNLVDNVVQELPFVGGLFGGGRIPISSALPYSDDGLKGAIEDISEGNWANIGKEMMNPILNVALPVGGGQIKKTMQGLSMFNTNEEHPIAGSYTDSGNLRFPVEDTLGNRIQAGIFGQWANDNARDYIENGRTPLSPKNTKEFIDVDLPIADYWKYREGLKGLKTNAEKADYINSLDIENWQKNLLLNNILDRKEDVDMSNYDDYSSYEEFDYATKNPEKYAFAKSVGGYSAYKKYSDELNDIKADKDANGKTITGSRKEKVIEYINNLDADYEAKIILFKSEYPSDDTYNEDIINYLNNREDLTYEEKVTIFTELGFTVKDGYIYWD